jgi:small subunit ribosomal protein S21
MANEDQNKSSTEPAQTKPAKAGSQATSGNTNTRNMERSATQTPYNQNQSQSQNDRYAQNDRQRGGAMEVHVEHNIDKAMKILKRKLIKEGLFKELKARRYFEKPSERKKRKGKESFKKARKEESRNRKNQNFFS